MNLIQFTMCQFMFIAINLPDFWMSIIFFPFYQKVGNFTQDIMLHIVQSRIHACLLYLNACLVVLPQSPDTP